MLKNLLSLFLQENCPLCERSTQEEICIYCHKQLKSCQFKNPAQFWSEDLPLFVWGKYDGKLKQAIAALKYDKHQAIGELLGIWLGETWLNCRVTNSFKSVRAIPIPLHPEKQKTRGFNQAEIIAKNFCQITSFSLDSTLLQRVKKTEAMFNLNAQEKQQNIQQAFQVRKQLIKQKRSQKVLLIDDIYTTGTTAKEATRMLRKEGIKVLGIAAIAKPIYHQA
ncbi:MAG TPA: ComF family protein [Cyanothece sp. UBA12306]|nr:ComF family protein [Cyanothece sp. UBA12306]